MEFGDNNNNNIGGARGRCWQIPLDDEKDNVNKDGGGGAREATHDLAERGC
jgi:hypothetical protein